MIDEKINLLCEVLDATLNLKCFNIKNLENNENYLRRIIPSIFTVNENDFNRFLNSMLNTEENSIYFIEDFIFSNYIIICLNQEEKNYLYIGPYLRTNNYNTLLNNLKSYDLPEEYLKCIERYYSSMPFLSQTKITSIISIIKNNIYGEGVNINFIHRSNLKDSYYIRNNSKILSLESMDYKFIEDSVILEHKFLGAVGNGIKVNSMKYLDRILNLHFNDNTINSLRSYKNKLIYYNTLLLRTVRIKGISNIYTEYVFQHYMEKIESIKHINEIKKIFQDMVVEYCFVVSEFNTKNFSELVINVINYINSNLQNNFTVSEISNLFFVSPTYLSKLFKKETGYSIMEYINRLKINHSSFLLRNTTLKIQDIGELTGINDVNYFSRLFKKYMNETPTKYRKKYRSY